MIKILLEIDFDNPEFGYIIFVDEISVVFKDIFYSPYALDFITFLTQVRKLGIFFVGTFQIWSKADKMVRDFFRTNGQVIFCNKLVSGLTLQKYADMTTAIEDSKNNLKYDVAKSKLLWHSPEMYESYDTFAVVSAIKNIGRKGVNNNGS